MLLMTFTRYIIFFFLLANYCGERCDDSMSCLACIAGYQPPNCCECEEGYLSVLSTSLDRFCCQNSMIDIEGMYNNCEYLNH